MKRLTAMEIHARKVEELGLDPSAVDLTSTEAIAAALRRVASFLCPCATPTLVRAVVRPLRGLVDNLDVIKEVTESTLDGLIAHGDILEQCEVGGDSEHGLRVLLYAAPPSFLPRQSGAVILLGIASDQLSALPDELQARIEYVTHVRRLVPLPGEDLHAELVELGLVELSYDSWLRSPPVETPAQHILRLNRVLGATAQSFDIPGLSLLDPTRPVSYYRSRWVEPTTHTGRFVGRRSQAYGADLWCYVEMNKGSPVRFVDFPLRGSVWRGCDEAWRLQAAIDRERGTPQIFRARPGPGGTRVLDFFSPVPMWARRRWDAIGEPVMSSGCLFSYRLGESEFQEEIRFIEQDLWLAQTS